MGNACRSHRADAACEIAALPQDDATDGTAYTPASTPRLAHSAGMSDSMSSIGELPGMVGVPVRVRSEPILPRYTVTPSNYSSTKRMHAPPTGSSTHPYYLTTIYVHVRMPVSFMREFDAEERECIVFRRTRVMDGYGLPRSALYKHMHRVRVPCAYVDIPGAPPPKLSYVRCLRCATKCEERATNSRANGSDDAYPQKLERTFQSTHESITYRENALAHFLHCRDKSPDFAILPMNARWAGIHDFW